ncbi:hypothetical protein Hypma_003207 [Hypsizygus marmoreus]|uniref:Uncharacterized protein n=1 Tax=Hypsizygus marmoreus TaxID=39966 RepID=A0A369K2N9_HYPMA|nr:hypothetical protein Hypma_003207 [Hypsizygus marmoreus]
MTTTTIGILSAPETSETVTISPYHPEGFAHALLIDLSACEDLPGDVKDPITLYDAEKLAAYKLFLERLRMIVKEDGQKHPPIDMVSFIDTNTTEGPSNHTYRALDGLKPLHAEFHCGAMEGCEISRIDRLQTPWPLESLFVAGLLDEDCQGGLFPPKACKSLKSLTLKLCCGIKFSPSGGAPALRYLAIIENDAPGMFNSICEKNPGLEMQLQTLIIHDVGLPCAYSSGEFKAALKRSTSLVTLELVLGPVPQERRLEGGTDDDGNPTDGGGGVQTYSAMYGDEDADMSDYSDSNEDEDMSGNGDDDHDDNGDDDEDMSGDDDSDGDDDNENQDADMSGHYQRHEVGNGLPYPGYRVSPWHGTEFPYERADEPKEERVDEPKEKPVLAPIGIAQPAPKWEPTKPEALYLDLLQYLPASLENLRFRGPTKVVEDLPAWREAASNPSWLPNLKTLAFRLDVPRHKSSGRPPSSAEIAGLFSESQPEVQKFLDTVSASRPSVKIVEFSEDLGN